MHVAQCCCCLYMLHHNGEHCHCFCLLCMDCFLLMGMSFLCTGTMEDDCCMSGFGWRRESGQSMSSLLGITNAFQHYFAIKLTLVLIYITFCILQSLECIQAMCTDVFLCVAEKEYPSCITSHCFLFTLVNVSSLARQPVIRFSAVFKQNALSLDLFF